jgi:hypothetical protein
MKEFSLLNIKILSHILKCLFNSNNEIITFSRISRIWNVLKNKLSEMCLNFAISENWKVQEFKKF